MVPRLHAFKLRWAPFRRSVPSRLASRLDIIILVDVSDWTLPLKVAAFTEARENLDRFSTTDVKCDTIAFGVRLSSHN